MGYLLGIDLGTSSVRATLVAPEGDVVEIAARQYPISIPRSDWAEQDPPELWWQSTCEAIKEVMHKSGTALCLASRKCIVRRPKCAQANRRAWGGWVFVLPG